MIPLAVPGPLSEEERFLFDVAGYLVVPDALSSEEVADCLEAAKRVHTPYPPEVWRQQGAAYEQEPALEALIDHPSVFPKVRALLGDYFILQSSWCTRVPPGFPGGGWHQDGSSAYEFRRLATPTPLVQLRVGFFLTDQTREDQGNMVLIPGSHNASVPIPRRKGWDDVPIKEVIRGRPGTVLLFHQGVYHCGTTNQMEYHRYIQHVVYAPPWLIPSDRMRNDPEFLARTTPLRRALLGEWNRPEEPFGAGYQRPPFEDG
jgi:ectoine hydroxylase-related dioxygenase (phytanoyl-CoA dioxygenase family)